MDDFPQEKPRFWIAFTILCIALAAAFVMVVFTSTRVEAQQQAMCSHMDKLPENMERAFHERQIWQGVQETPTGQAEVFLYQSQDGKWSMFMVMGKDPTGKEVGCLVASGTNGVPNDLGKGV